MERHLTYLQIGKNKRIPTKVWESFCVGHPWCSPEIHISYTHEDQIILGTLFYSLLDTTLCQANYSRLDMIMKMFEDHACEQPDGIECVQQFYKRILPNFKYIYANISKVTLLGSQSKSRKTLASERLEKSRKFLSSHFAKKQQYFAEFLKGLALSVYLRKDFHGIGCLQHLVKKYKRTDIIQNLACGLTIADHNLFFMEEYYLRPVSYLLSIAFHFHYNQYDEANKQLASNIIESSPEVQDILSFMLKTMGTENVVCTIQILPSISDEQILRNHYTEEVSTAFPLVDLIESLFHFSEHEYHRVSEYWIGQIVQLIYSNRVDPNIEGKELQLDDETNKQLLLVCQRYSLPSSIMQERLLALLRTGKRDFEQQIKTNIAIMKATLTTKKIIDKDYSPKARYFYEPDSSTTQKENSFSSKKDIFLQRPTQPQFIDFEIPDFNENLIDTDENEDKVALDLHQVRPQLNSSNQISHTSNIIYRENNIRSQPLKNQLNSLRFEPTEPNKRSMNLQDLILRSETITSKVIVSGTIKSQSNYFQSNKISEYIQGQSDMRKFICPICYDQIKSEKDMMIVHDDHRLCKSCLKDWIKIKINAYKTKRPQINCPIQRNQGFNLASHRCEHLIDEETIKGALTKEEFTQLQEHVSQVLDSKLRCPWEGCQASIEFSYVDEQGFVCPKCDRQICLICKEKSHGDKICPLREEQIKLALRDDRIGCCPNCLEIFMKNDGCQHVQCSSCSSEFCFACSADRVPIMSHGAHYHRQGCEFREAWVDPETSEEIWKEEYEPGDCEQCRRTKAACKRPMSLDLFRKLARLDF